MANQCDKNRKRKPVPPKKLKKPKTDTAPEKEVDDDDFDEEEEDLEDLMEDKPKQRGVTASVYRRTESGEYVTKSKERKSWLLA